jgi:2-C-methyl-D-erythritol 2,4-cyclodiphosphate synthase
MVRIGIGYDLHPLAEGRPLILGGVRITYVKGLNGNSDADALTHALIDALLGAAALGNIGQLFPESNPHFKNANSMKLLGDTMTLIKQEGYRVVNMDANIVAEEPRLSPYIENMCATLAEALEVTPDLVSVKAKTNEGFCAEGRGEAISTQVVVLIEKV